jgi:tRNA wybutosine-synthesizing protein 2
VERHDATRVALPVVAHPSNTAVVEVIEKQLPQHEQDLHDILRAAGWTDSALETVPSAWGVIGSTVVVESDSCPNPEAVGQALLSLHGEADTVLTREAVVGRFSAHDTRVIAGEGDTETIHTEDGTRYAIDLSEMRFSPGNAPERSEMATQVEDDERVFDMFAGIGHFTLPMARAGAEVLAAEVHPTPYRYLIENAVLNGVQERVEAYRADSADLDIKEPVDRVVMGHIKADEWLDTAIAAIRSAGTLHCHAATSTEKLWDRPVDRIEAAARRAGRSVELVDRRVMKGHGAGVEHVVIDANIN